MHLLFNSNIKEMYIISNWMISHSRRKLCCLNILKGPKIYVVVNFASQVIFDFLLFLGMVMFANEVETKEK